MGFLSNLKDALSETSSDVANRVKRFRNARFADAAMATCALVSAADGTIDADERRKTASFISMSDVLSCFEVAELQEKYNEYCGIMEKDFDFGKINLLRVIGKVKGNEEESKTVVQVGCLIGASDGDFDDNEKAVVREICQLFGLDAGDFF